MEGTRRTGRLKRAQRIRKLRGLSTVRAAVLISVAVLAVTASAHVQDFLPSAPVAGAVSAAPAWSGAFALGTSVGFTAHVAPSMRGIIGDQGDSWFGIASDAAHAEGRAFDALRWFDGPVAWADGRSSMVTGDDDAVGSEAGLRGTPGLSVLADRAGQAPGASGDAARWLAGIGLVVLLAWRKLSDPRNRL